MRGSLTAVPVCCQGPRLKGRRLANKAFLRGIVPAENAVHRTRTRPTASTL